ncbi:putative cytochrome c oxidase assembly protein COX19 [Phytophthora infestans]|uniref:Putative cytochrome c oxidase assembly protein COX19 n=1 Tax=Phytophthora infestans TaxID=4787 RepID=A0A8S9TUL5_PHYIN|nr:putative cytochrome c oxidase assembly protein COX19 [Phytophthora infestans]
MITSRCNAEKGIGGKDEPPSQSKRPPEKGSFPLDHYGECKPAMKEFLVCMREHRNSHIDCKTLSAAYLQCRMDKGLMKPEELEKLGFHEEGMKKMWTEQTNEGRKEGEGFVAGLGIKKSRYEKK